MNTYNSYFLAAMFVFFGLIIEKGVTLIPKSSLGLLVLAFFSASASIFFIPLKKYSGYDQCSARRLWLYTLVLSQFTVILTVVGVLSAIIIGLKLL